MPKMEERLKILENVIEIEGIETQEIKLEYACHKYSSKKNNIYHISLNGKHLSKRDPYRIKYKCVMCESLHIVGVTQFLRKINKCSYRCNLCCKDVTHQKINKSITNMSLTDKKEESVKLFQEQDDDFKEDFFRSHLTSDDYKRICKNLISLENGKRMIDANLEYWPIFKTSNQMLFTSVFYDKANDMILKANQPIMKCDTCSKTWRAKSLHRFKNCYKILCTDCTLCNKTFKIRQTQNNINQTILYQSKLEMKFIRWCNSHNKTVRNGPTLSYKFDGKIHRYKVDFMIDDILIEIKDHQLNLQQISSEKWKAKEKAVYKEIEKGIYSKYYLITPQNWVHCLNKLLQVK